MMRSYKYKPGEVGIDPHEYQPGEVRDDGYIQLANGLHLTCGTVTIKDTPKNIAKACEAGWTVEYKKSGPGTTASRSYEKHRAYNRKKEYPIMTETPPEACIRPMHVVPEVKTEVTTKYFDAYGGEHSSYEAADRENKARTIETIITNSFNGGDVIVMKTVIRELLKKESELVQILGARY